MTGGVTAVTAGGAFTMALQNGTLYSWGDNSVGQLGNGNTTQQNTPVAVNLLTNVTAVAGGSAHSLAIQNGALYTWGYNRFGQLGIGSADTVSHSTPIAIAGFSTGVTAVAAGEIHSLAIKSGAAYAWGDNFEGDVGNGNATQQNSPVAVIGLSTGVTAVAAGYEFSLALKGGNVYAWGNGSSGELGGGSPTASPNSTPAEVMVNGLPLASIVAIAAGSSSSYALSSDGSLWVWGDNFDGELGLGSTGNEFTIPQHLLPPSGETYTAIEADNSEAIAILAPEPSVGALLSVVTVGLLRRRRHPSKYPAGPNVG